MKKLLVPALFALIFVLLWSGFDQNSITSFLFRPEAPKADRDAYLQQRLAFESENDRRVFLIDNGDFVEKGIVRIPPMTGQTGYIGAIFDYQIEENPTLIDVATGAEYPLDIQNGETLYLATYGEPDGTNYVAWYKCYTNSRTCNIQLQKLPIVVSKS